MTNTEMPPQQAPIEAARPKPTDQPRQQVSDQARPSEAQVRMAVRGDVPPGTAGKYEYQTPNKSEMKDGGTPIGPTAGDGAETSTSDQSQAKPPDSPADKWQSDRTRGDKGGAPDDKGVQTKSMPDSGSETKGQGAKTPESNSDKEVVKSSEPSERADKNLENKTSSDSGAGQGKEAKEALHNLADALDPKQLAGGIYKGAIDNLAERFSAAWKGIKDDLTGAEARKALAEGRLKDSISKLPLHSPFEIVTGLFHSGKTLYKGVESGSKAIGDRINSTEHFNKPGAIKNIRAADNTIGRAGVDVAVEGANIAVTLDGARGIVKGVAGVGNVERGTVAVGKGMEKTTAPAVEKGLEKAAAPAVEEKTPPPEGPDTRKNPELAAAPEESKPIESSNAFRYAYGDNAEKVTEPFSGVEGYNAGQRSASSAANTVDRPGVTEMQDYVSQITPKDQGGEGKIGIQQPGKVNVRGPDSIVFDPDRQVIQVRDTKNRGPDGSFPKPISQQAADAKWGKEVEQAVFGNDRSNPREGCRTGDAKLDEAVRQAFIQHRIEYVQVNVRQPAPPPKGPPIDLGPL